MGSHPRPHWFLVRPDNTVTPLIAVDELPSGVHIAGVPATMSLAETKSMESVGVRERSTATYLVQSTTSSGNSDSPEELTRSSDPTGSGVPSKKSAIASESGSGRGPNDGVEEAPFDPQMRELGNAPDLDPDCQEVQDSTGTTSNPLRGREIVSVETWRRDVETPDETQAKIDAVLAANESAREEPQGAPKDENPRALRTKAGLVPGKKVYCSHWIRNGDCDFMQQGCLYKHEMPDNDTLRAIGIRAMPSWYIVAHPEKARERGWGSGKAPSSSRTWRPTSVSIPPPAFGPVRLPVQAYSQSFQPPLSFGSSARIGSTFFPPPASPAFPRVQELTDQQYQQWQRSAGNRTSELQVAPKVYRSPGYKTYPFPAPAPVSASSTGTSHAKPEPVWAPRQSKLTKGLTSLEEDPTPTQAVTNSGFAPLKPLRAHGFPLPASSARQQGPGISSELFDLAPTVNAKAPRQMFSSAGREDQMTESKAVEPIAKERSPVREMPNKMGGHEVTGPDVYQVDADKQPERRWNSSEDREKRLAWSPPKGKSKVKRAVKAGGPSSGEDWISRSRRAKQFRKR